MGPSDTLCFTVSSRRTSSSRDVVFTSPGEIGELEARKPFWKAAGFADVPPSTELPRLTDLD